MDKQTFDALCRRDFSVFFQRAWREIEGQDYTHNWHIDCLAEYLQGCYEDRFRKLIINVPPRTGKTMLVNIAFTAWLLGQDPSIRVIGISYAQRLSEKIAYRARLLMETEWYKALFPDTKLDPNQSQKSNFLTTGGGGRFSTSVGGVATGEGCHFMLVDDPVNPAEALSDVQRLNTNEWLDQTIYSRFDNPKNAHIVLIMQRLHDDDPTGHFLATGNWTHVKMPAYTEEELIFEPGNRYSYSDYLHEERLDGEILEEMHTAMSSYAYAGQYLQNPVPIGGGDFNRDMLQYFSCQRFDAKGCNIYITIDPAKSKNEGADYTAMVVWALAPDQNYYIVDGLRERLQGKEKILRLFALHKKWMVRSGNSPKVGYEQVGLAEDVHYIRNHMNDINYRFSITELKPPPKTSKEDRIRRLAPFMAEHKVWIPEDLFFKNEKGLSENLINVIVEQELLLFPRGKHDDFIDAMAMIFDLSPVFPEVQEFRVNETYNYHDESFSVLDI
jgi:predicted phage terminase large subunit-like protein